MLKKLLLTCQPFVVAAAEVVAAVAKADAVAEAAVAAEAEVVTAVEIVRNALTLTAKANSFELKVKLRGLNFQAAFFCAITLPK